MSVSRAHRWRKRDFDIARFDSDHEPHFDGHSVSEDVIAGKLVALSRQRSLLAAAQILNLLGVTVCDVDRVNLSDPPIVIAWPRRGSRDERLVVG